MSNIPPRLLGIENEYMASYKVADPNGSNMHLGDVTEPFRARLAELYPADVPNICADPGFQITNRWLGNGSRYYMDVGDHIETTTPECVSFYDVVAYDMAGEGYVADHIQAAFLSGLFTVIMLNKRVADHSSPVNTTGAHENYGVSEGFLRSVIHAERKKTVGVLAAHLITRSIFTGAGVVAHDGRFHVTQKLQDIEFAASSGATMHKPLISFREEKLSDGKKYSNRLHIVSGDSNISPWATWMKLGTTSVVMRLLEHGVKLEDVILHEPMAAASQVDHDVTVSTKLVTVNGEKRSAMSIQERLLEEARELGGRVELPAEELEVIDEWQEVLDDLKEDPDKCDDRIDWVARRKRIDAPTKRVVDNDAAKARARDLGYDVMLPIRGSGLRLRDEGGFRRTPTDQQVQYSRLYPPENTRANVRGKAVRTFIERGPLTRPKIRSWDGMIYKGMPFHMKNPFESSTDRFNNWIEDIDTRIEY